MVFCGGGRCTRHIFWKRTMWYVSVIFSCLSQRFVLPNCGFSLVFDITVRLLPAFIVCCACRQMSLNGRPHWRSASHPGHVSLMTKSCTDHCSFTYFTCSWYLLWSQTELSVSRDSLHLSSQSLVTDDQSSSSALTASNKDSATSQVCLIVVFYKVPLVA